MIWFHRLYPAAMILLPSLLVLLSRRAHPAEDAAARARRLHLATAACLAAHAVAVLSLPESALGAWSRTAAFGGFFGLWFGLGVQAMGARHAGWRGPPRSPVRTASLEPRTRRSPVPPAAWAAGHAFFAACAAVAAWAVSRGLPPVFLLGLTFWPAGVWGARATLFEPEPLDREGSLRRDYERLRKMRAWGFFWFGAAGTGVMTAAGAAVALGAGPAAAWLGAAFGVAGGAWGTAASFARARVNARLRDG